VLILARSIPEYLWAFLLLTLLGPGAWRAGLALALHNAGILGRLYAEVTENVDPRTPRALRALGASRLGIALTAIWPASLGRFLLFFFYRWETCVREATILGLLGFSGLGFYILQAQAALRWDELALWTLLGSALIIAGDLVSAPTRALVRNAR
jgi:phosphonate transport system permease protein